MGKRGCKTHKIQYAEVGNYFKEDRDGPPELRPCKPRLQRVRVFDYEKEETKTIEAVTMN
jgi:hypothetical protein